MEFIEHVHIFTVFHGTDRRGSKADDGPLTLDGAIVVKEEVVSFVDDYQRCFVGLDSGCISLIFLKVGPPDYAELQAAQLLKLSNHFRFKFH